MSENIKGYIYLLKMCDTNNRIIYKPGKSINFYKRYKEYNYAEILIFIISDDITKDENEIIKLFNINCKLDTGREFFLAKDDNFVLKLFIDYFSNKINRSIKNNNIINIINDVVNEVVSDDVSNEIISDVINEVSNEVSNEVCGDEVVGDEVVGDVVSDEVVGDVVSDVVSDEVVGNEILSDVVSNNESSNTIETLENRQILERTCPNCKKVFNFSSRLKAHLESTIHCKKSPEDITKFFKKFEKKSNFKCDICCSKYTKLQNLQRHIKNTNCNKFIKQNKLLKEIETIKLEIINLNVNN
jgi:hypothetical protein